MLITNHVLAGALLGRIVARRPAVAFGAAIVSHFAMDACPHWGTGLGIHDQEFLRVAKCDGCAGLLAMAVSAGLAPGKSRRAVTAAMVGAALPDADKPFQYFLGINPFPDAVQRFHGRVQNEAPGRMPFELATACALLIVALVWSGR